MVNKKIRQRQSKASRDGREQEMFLKEILLDNHEIASNFLIDKPSRILELEVLNKEEKENIKREIEIEYNGILEEIDADLCIVRKTDKKLIAVISVKKSFRERGAQTAYWALKVKQSCKNYKYILATPDTDKELYDEQNEHKKRKWRVILPYECDAVFIYSYSGKKYKENKFYVGLDYLIEFIVSLRETE